MLREHVHFHRLMPSLAEFRKCRWGGFGARLLWLHTYMVDSSVTEVIVSVVSGLAWQKKPCRGGHVLIANLVKVSVGFIGPKLSLPRGK